MSPERPVLHIAGSASPLRFPLGASPLPPAGVPRGPWTSGAWPARDARSSRSPLRLALREWSGLSEVPSLLWPLLTSRTAVYASLRRRPFRREARSPRIRTVAFVAQPPDLRSFPLVAGALRFDARSPRSATPHIRFLFVGSRLRYPASFSAPLTVGTLRIASVPATRSREDFHLLTTAHVGRTSLKGRPRGGAGPSRW